MSEIFEWFMWDWFLDVTMGENSNKIYVVCCKNALWKSGEVIGGVYVPMTYFVRNWNVRRSFSLVLHWFWKMRVHLMHSSNGVFHWLLTYPMTGYCFKYITVRGTGFDNYPIFCRQIYSCVFGLIRFRKVFLIGHLFILINSSISAFSQSPLLLYSIELMNV